MGGTYPYLRNGYCVSLAPLRNRHQDGIKCESYLLGKMSVRKNGDDAGEIWENFGSGMI